MQNLGNIEQKTTTILIGKPRVGKSTLLNCLLGKAVFKSGITFKYRRLTQDIQTYTSSDGNHYVDTPGITKKNCDIVLRAFQQGGVFKILFVVALKAQTISPRDLQLIHWFLDNTQITSCSIIINQVPPQFIQLKDGKQESISQINSFMGLHTSVYWNMRTSELECAANHIVPLDPQLVQFFHNTYQVNIPPNLEFAPKYDIFEMPNIIENLEMELVRYECQSEQTKQLLPVIKAQCMDLLCDKEQIKAEIMAIKAKVLHMTQTVVGYTEESSLRAAQRENLMHQQTIKLMKDQLADNKAIIELKLEHQLALEKIEYEKHRSELLEKRITDHNYKVNKQKNIIWWLIFFAILVLGIISFKPDNNHDNSKFALTNYTNIVFEGDVHSIAPNVTSWITSALQQEFHNETVRIVNNQTSVSGSVVIFLKIAHTRINEDMTPEDDGKIRSFTKDACVVSIILVDITQLVQSDIYGAYEKQNAHNLENEVYILQRPYYKEDFDLYSKNKCVIANMVHRIKKHNCIKLM